MKEFGVLVIALCAAGTHVAGAPQWSITVNGSDRLELEPGTPGPVSITLTANLNTDGNPVNGWQHALKTDHPELWTYGSPVVHVVAPGFQDSDIVFGPPAAGSAITNDERGEVSVFAFTGGDRPAFNGPAVVFNVVSRGSLPPSSYSRFWIGDSGLGFFMANTQSPDGINFGLSAPFTLRVGFQFEGQIALKAATSRRTHGAAGSFDLPCPLTGPPGRDPRQPGSAPAIVLSFYLSTDDPPGYCGDIIITNATCTSVTRFVKPPYEEGDAIVTLADVPKNACVTVKVIGPGGVVGDADVSVIFQEGDVNGNGTVDSSDLQAIQSQLHQPVTAANFKNDVTCNGAINILDLQAVKNNFSQPAACP